MKIKRLLTDAILRVGYHITTINIESQVATATTEEGDALSIMIAERDAKRVDDCYFSLSSDGIESCRACECRWLAVVFGSKACAVVEVDAPDFESFDEFGDLVYTYANPLCNG